MIQIIFTLEARKDHYQAEWENTEHVREKETLLKFIES